MCVHKASDGSHGAGRGHALTPGANKDGLITHVGHAGSTCFDYSTGGSELMTCSCLLYTSRCV